MRAAGLLVFFVLIFLVGRSIDARDDTSVPQPLPAGSAWKDGDIVFQGGTSEQSTALQQATGSAWTHCGIVFTDERGAYVIEAVQPVKRTPLESWLKRGTGIYSAKRLVDEDVLTPRVIERMKKVAQGFIGRNYDPFFQWNDERIYCSELVWKVYKEGAGLEVGEVERFGDMDLTGGEAQRILKARFGNSIPADEPVVSPAAIHRSPLLHTLYEGSALAE